jgi:hypothetical protein
MIIKIKNRSHIIKKDNKALNPKEDPYKDPLNPKRLYKDPLNTKEDLYKDPLNTIKTI